MCEEEEEILEEYCPVCGYPLVIEYGLRVCYQCGWSEEEIEQ